MALDQKFETGLNPETRGESLERSNQEFLKDSGKEKTGDNAPKVSPLVLPKNNVGAAPGSAQKTFAENIENILEEGMGDLYFSLSPENRVVFKRKGEETTKKIIDLMEKGKATFKKIFHLIVSWLKTIPGVNKFFLEQEAKIKADKIMKVKK